MPGRSVPVALGRAEIRDAFPPLSSLSTSLGEVLGKIM